ncbi:2-amino-3-ketobutyrate coenzyme A ligase [Pseudonocardia sediminis]|uniref:8-amino-7-oxononanoate synthase n=1 Tax=Pseudonocardia sediminis TaxID=1397368 RepID=A0A4V2FQT9_PSEST|nr:glycine C-acetyltransferase [Pseudonocardia sediminis]RZT85690.1 2-amino-3-ketobutyrate coenzyme A ligase [Pseudonocardia sediminis]
MQVIESPQSSHVRIAGREVLNFATNDYLGLADDPGVIEAAKRALDRRGFGMASVRFVAGTQDLHVELESALSDLLGTEGTVLFSSCFDANGGLFEALLDERDVVISDELNHASIIDGIRLCRAGRRRYRHRDTDDLGEQLALTRGARRRVVVTDGVFSMDGSYAPLAQICRLAAVHDALVVVDDSHAVGVVGATGAGTPELLGVADQVDVVTGTLGKALGGAAGGYVSGRRHVVDVVRRRARPYLFSNALPPPIVAGAATALRISVTDVERRARVQRNAADLRAMLADEGFDLLGTDHPIVPVMIGDVDEAERMASSLRERGIHVVAFGYPVVPHGSARLRIQVSAAHTPDDLRRCTAALVAARADRERS